MPRQEHPLAVQHLQDGELGEIGNASVLDGRVGKEYGVGSGLEGNAVLPGAGNETPFHEVLYAVRGAPALDSQISLGNRDP